MSLESDLERIAGAAGAFATAGERVAAIIPAEPAESERVYLCAFDGADDTRTWLALDAAGTAIEERRLVREAVAIAALCEIAEESAAPGVGGVVDGPPRLASPAYLDKLGAAARELERSTGHASDSPFAHVMRSAAPTVEELERDVERGYKVPLR